MIDPRILDQLRRVRWRRRFRELQRAAYPALAVAGLGGAAAVLSALRAGTTLFVATAFLAAVALAGTAAFAGRAAWRRRLPRDRAVVWTDDTAGLRGILATLVTARMPGPFAALLAERNLALLRRWTPERVVPGVVPVGPAIAAAIAVVAFGLVLRLAPMLLPSAASVIVVDSPLVPVDARGFSTRADRVTVGASEERFAGGSGSPDAAPVSGLATGGGGASASWPMLVQERLRRSLWGRDWERVREALERAAQQRAPATARDGSTRDRGNARLASAGGRTGAGGTPGSSRQAATEPGSDELATTGESEGGVGSGAGDGTDANLFAESDGVVHDDADPFALALAARVRTMRAGARPPSGDTPSAAPDERPTLAARQRREEAVHRMPIPAAWEPIVGALFTHSERTP